MPEKTVLDHGAIVFFKKCISWILFASIFFRILKMNVNDVNETTISFFLLFLYSPRLYLLSSY